MFPHCIVYNKVDRDTVNTVKLLHLYLFQIEIGVRLLLLFFFFLNRSSFKSKHIESENS